LSFERCKVILIRSIYISVLSVSSVAKQFLKILYCLYLQNPAPNSTKRRKEWEKSFIHPV
jgi:hypothetical protein